MAKFTVFVICGGCGHEMYAHDEQIALELLNATPAYCEQWHPASEI